MRPYRLFIVLILLIALVACGKESPATPTEPPAAETEPTTAPTATTAPLPTTTAVPLPTAEPTAIPLADQCVEPIYLAIVWHQHQPVYYQDPETGIYAKPWVRLHAAKDYVDMAAMLNKITAFIGP